jgi:hypothetical protein
MVPLACQNPASAQDEHKNDKAPLCGALSVWPGRMGPPDASFGFLGSAPAWQLVCRAICAAVGLDLSTTLQPTEVGPCHQG